MRRNRIVNLIGATAVCVTFAARGDGGATGPTLPGPHSEQGGTDVRTWTIANPMHPLHWIWLQHITSTRGRYFEQTPGDQPDDVPGGGEPANPCPDGLC